MTDPLTVLRHGLDRYEWARDRDAEDAALADVEALIEAARELLPYAQLDDPWAGGIENYRWLLSQFREALARLDKEDTP